MPGLRIQFSWASLVHRRQYCPRYSSLFFNHHVRPGGVTRAQFRVVTHSTGSESLISVDSSDSKSLVTARCSSIAASDLVVSLEHDSESSLTGSESLIYVDSVAELVHIVRSSVAVSCTLPMALEILAEVTLLLLGMWTFMLALRSLIWKGSYLFFLVHALTKRDLLRLVGLFLPSEAKGSLLSSVYILKGAFVKAQYLPHSYRQAYGK